ncbi:HK97 gp10 family phage protein [Clostridium sp. JS66]|uniref:HK97 gp10 family phage protein n=1 Tax=Clostridium sp. JS66 TaxID=3064705 RepID=UPI00298D754E|nr:HK97 gp10 family phage protein [Clostridium sp. JS66]WPC42957.1 HK97 gp10 family phage protein [Clostridium sp. JS66]
MSDFNIDIKDVLEGLLKFETKSKIALELYGDTAAKKLEAEAKKNASWEDRTGQSRQTIQGGTQQNGDNIDIYVAGNTEYFPYLELCNDKKYAILQPTVNKLSPKILKGMDNLLGK